MRFNTIRYNMWMPEFRSNMMPSSSGFFQNTCNPVADKGVTIKNKK
jgi:hypothetical protein